MESFDSFFKEYKILYIVFLIHNICAIYNTEKCKFKKYKYNIHNNSNFMNKKDNVSISRIYSYLFSSI